MPVTQHRLGEHVRSAPALEWSQIGTNETTLIERCIARDEDACRTLVEEHQQMVFQLAVALLGDREEALDLSQEVFFRVFRTLPSFRGDAALRTWIYRIVINQTRNRHGWWRRRGRSAQVSLEDHTRAHGEPRARGRPSPEERIDHLRLGARLREAVARLPFDQRSALVLREYHGLRYQEISFALGVTVGTVKSRLARARAMLRTKLRDLWPD